MSREGKVRQAREVDTDTGKCILVTVAVDPINGEAPTAIDFPFAVEDAGKYGIGTVVELSCKKKRKPRTAKTAETEGDVVDVD